MARPAILLGRLGLLLGAMLLFVLALEGVLQLGAWVVGAASRVDSAGPRGEALRIVSLGDSNTYGLYLDAEEAYPKQLEALWEAGGFEPRVEVVNLGYPGTNSSVLVREFDRVLDSLSPDVVLVMVGVNDYWTQAVESDPEAASRGVWAGLWDRIRRSSRVWRLLAIIGTDADEIARAPERPALDGPTIEIPVGQESLSFGWVGPAALDEADARRQGGMKTPAQQASAHLQENLAMLAERAEARDVVFAVLTYPANRSIYGRANRVIREAAGQSGLDLIDLTPVAQSHCADAACTELFFEDNHPRAAGHAIVAEELVNALPPLIQR